jgi:hypothetical protein
MHIAITSPERLHRIVRLVLKWSSQSLGERFWYIAHRHRSEEPVEPSRPARAPASASRLATTSRSEHGGTIEVDSRVGAFTEFTVRLPRARRVAAAEAASWASVSWSWTTKDFVEGFAAKFQPLVVTQEVKLLQAAPSWGPHP